MEGRIHLSPGTKSSSIINVSKKKRVLRENKISRSVIKISAKFCRFEEISGSSKCLQKES